MNTPPAFRAPIPAGGFVPTVDFVESEALSVQLDFKGMALKAALNAADGFNEKQLLDFIPRRVNDHAREYSIDYCEGYVRRCGAEYVAGVSRTVLRWAQSDPYAAVRQCFDQPASGAVLVDSGWLYLLYPGFGDALAGLACRLDAVAAQVNVPSDQPLKKVAAAFALAAEGDLVALDFWHDLAAANRSFPPEGLEILLGAAFMDSGRLIFPGYVPSWYSCEQRRPGPGRDAIDRAQTWGHYVVSLALGTQKEALDFWHSYSKKHGCAGEASYSQPGQDATSQRALSAYVMAKGRLFSDLTRVKALPWPALSGSGSEPSVA